MDGMENLMRKLYPENFEENSVYGTNIEESLELCIGDLHRDGVQILTSFKGGIDKKMQIETEAKVYRRKYVALFKKIDDTYNKLIEEVELSIQSTKNKKIFKDLFKVLKIYFISNRISKKKLIQEVSKLLKEQF